MRPPIPVRINNVRYDSVAIAALHLGISISKVRGLLNDPSVTDWVYLEVRNRKAYGRLVCVSPRRTAVGTFTCIPTQEFYTFTTLKPEQIIKSLGTSASILGRNIRLRTLFNQYRDVDRQWRFDWRWFPNQDDAKAFKKTLLDDIHCINKAPKVKRS